MKKWDVMSSSYAIWDNTLFGITNTEKILFRLNLSDGKIRYLDNPINYSRGMFGADQILLENDEIFILEVNGKRMMRYSMEDHSCHFIPLDCQVHLWGNFVKMTKYNNFIYIFLCYENVVIKLDIRTERYERIELSDLGVKYIFKTADIPEKLYSSACLVDNEIWLFAERQEYVIKYNLSTDDYKRYDLPGLGKGCVDVFYNEGNFYILNLEGGVYVWDAVFNKMKEVWSGYNFSEYPYFGKIIVAANKIWVLPCLGEDIIVISLDSQTVSKYLEYPEDFEYYQESLNSKYTYHCDDSNNYYLAMHAGNYILAISKQTGLGKWIDPVRPTQKDKALFFKNNKRTMLAENYGYTIKEMLGELSLITSSGGCNEDGQTALGKKIWQQMKDSLSS